MTPYIVLGKYVPSVWRTWAIGKDLTNLTKRQGYVPHYDPAHGPIHWAEWWYDDDLHAEVRKRTLNYAQAEDWHKDGDTTPGAKMDCVLVTWASVAPTQIMYEGRIYQPEPWELVAFQNILCSHRRPPKAPEDRWLFRQRAKVPASWRP